MKTDSTTKEISRSAKRKMSSTFMYETESNGKIKLVTVSRQKAGTFTKQVVIHTKVGSKIKSEIRHLRIDKY